MADSDKKLDDTFPPPSRGVKIISGFSQAVEYVKYIAFEIFVLFFYNQVLGLPGTLAGLAILISMIVDAITDPMVGSFSDSIRSRFGRRHTLMFGSVLPVGLFFLLLFSPPSGLGDWSLFAWLTGISICLRIALTFFAAPASAVVAEISPRPEDRAEMGIYRQAVSVLAQFTLLALAFDLFFAPTPEFANGQENPDAYPPFGAAAALAIMFFMLISAGGTWKHILRFEQNLGPSVRAPFSFGKAIAGWVDALGGSKNFRAIFFGLLAASTMGSLYRASTLYLGTYLWELEPGEIKYWQYAFLGGMLSAVVAARFIIPHLEPKRLYLTGYWFLFLGYLLPPALTAFGMMPGGAMLAPTLYGFNVAAGIGGGFLMICSLILFAEAADEFFFVRSISRTGMLFGLVTFGNKAASGLGKLLAGVLTDYAGFPSAEEIDQLTPEILMKFVVALVAFMAVIGLIGFAILNTYHLSRQRHKEVLEGIRKLTAEAKA